MSVLVQFQVRVPDVDKFKAAYAANPSAVTTLFTQQTTGLGAALSTQIDGLTDTTRGARH